MSQTKHFSFGVDNVSFIDTEYNVYSVDDPQNFQLNMQYETTIHRGGASNQIRDIGTHSPSAEVSLGTGYIDFDLAKLWTGGSITSLGTSASSIITGTASGVNTLFGSSATIPAGISTVTINSPTLVKTSDYYLKATGNAEVTVTRVRDGKEFAAVTLTNSATGFDLDTDYGIQFATTASATSLTVDEKGIIQARTAIETINQKITLDANKPCELTMRGVVDYCGYQREINIPISQPTGSVFGQSATEFQVQDLTFPVKWSQALEELADITLQG